MGNGVFVVDFEQVFANNKKNLSFGEKTDQN